MHSVSVDVHTGMFAMVIHFVSIMVRPEKVLPDWQDRDTSVLPFTSSVLLSSGDSAKDNGSQDIPCINSKLHYCMTRIMDKWNNYIAKGDQFKICSLGRSNVKNSYMYLFSFWRAEKKSFNKNIKDYLWRKLSSKYVAIA